MKLSHFLASLSAIGLLSTGLQAGVTYGANLAAPGVIFGTGNANGEFAISDDGITEVALRAKIPYQGIYNHAGSGLYKFDPGTVWNFEFSVHTLNGVIGDYTYLLELDSDPSAAVSFAAVSFNPITPSDNPWGVPYWDHDFADASTPYDSNGGVAAANLAEYQSLLATKSVVQNSWTMSYSTWLQPLLGYDVNASGLYDIKLSVLDGSSVVNSISIQVQAVPEPSVVLFGLTGLALGALVLRRRR